MITKEIIKRNVEIEISKHDDSEYRPIFEILTFENPDKEEIYPNGTHSGFPDMGCTNNPGFYHNLDDAYEAIVNNAGDIWETVYDAAFLLCKFPGLYNCVTSDMRMYFVFNKEIGMYEQKEEPDIFSHMAL